MNKYRDGHLVSAWFFDHELTASEVKELYGNPGEWHHFVGTQQEGHQMTLYRDGKLIHHSEGTP